jgi:hypothetical protein
MQLYVVVPCWYRCHRCRCRCGCGAGCGCGHRAGGGVCWASSSQLPYSVLCSSSSSCRRCDLCCGCATRPTPAATVPAGGGGRGRRRAAAAAAPRSSGRARRLAVASFVDLAVRLLCVHCTALRVHIVLHVDSCTIEIVSYSSCTSLGASHKIGRIGNGCFSPYVHTMKLPTLVVPAAVVRCVECVHGARAGTTALGSRS